MKKRIIIVVFCLLLFLSLVVFNPKKEDFINRTERILKKINNSEKDSLKKALYGIKNESQLLALKFQIKRKNCILFSIFDSGWPDHHKIIGFWRVFIQVK